MKRTHYDADDCSMERIDITPWMDESAGKRAKTALVIKETESKYTVELERRILETECLVALPKVSPANKKRAGGENGGR